MSNISLFSELVKVSEPYKIISFNGVCLPHECVMIDPNIILLIFSAAFLLGIFVEKLRRWRIKRYGINFEKL